MMLQGEHIICISSIDWDFNWQGHQEIMSELAAQGNRVLFIENTGVRAPALKDLWRLKVRLNNWRKHAGGFRKVDENLSVYSPVLLPFPYSRVARWINRLFFLRVLRQWVASTEFGRPIVWSFLPTGTALDIIGAVNPKAVVYYCIADFRKLVRNPKSIDRWEPRLLRRADVVFAQGPDLAERCRRHHADVRIFPFGVNTKRFHPDAAGPVPRELQAVRHPVIGYVGALHQHMDVDLLEQVARQRRDWSVVLVGPVYSDVSRLATLDNVLLLGPKRHADLPDYLGVFDVCMIPYRQSSYTKTVFPTKMNEYLGMGKPVVSSALPEVMDFRKQHGDVVRIADGADAFIREIEGALREPRHHMREARVAAAHEHSWERRIAEMSVCIEEMIRRRDTEMEVGWQERWRAVYRAARRRVLGPLIALGCLWAAVFYSPLVWWMAEPLRVTDPPVPSDVIVVFAGGVGESGRPGQGYEERVQYAVELYRRGLAGRLIFSSGYSYALKEAEVMKALAVSMGVPDGAIQLESQARNTYENVVNSVGIMRRHGWRSALVVSSPYHMRRVRGVCSRVAPDLSVRCAPIPVSRFYLSGKRFGQSVAVTHIRALAHEYLALASYRWKGYL